MKDKRVSYTDRRTYQRRKDVDDLRSDTERGIVGERRAGSDRRGNNDRREVKTDNRPWY